MLLPEKILGEEIPQMPTAINIRKCHISCPLGRKRELPEGTTTALSHTLQQTSWEGDVPGTMCRDTGLKRKKRRLSSSTLWETGVWVDEAEFSGGTEQSERIRIIKLDVLTVAFMIGAEQVKGSLGTGAHLVTESEDRVLMCRGLGDSRELLCFTRRSD